ncbi:type II toxin-antitoxin system Phd/YefM family antitoxin [Pararhizobium sp. LjRoot238]|uniref:type II toxin-antitoxin system Phd/YefM family antitoxin n=1 Tax=Pararhizobium sp. LjRoot238 TaxID=3342293 RepID=UPI003ECE7914
MSTVSLRDAKAGFSNLVDEAIKGEFVTITRHGKPVAALVSIEAAEAAKKIMKKTRPNFGEYLMAFPGGVELERNPSKMRDADL